MPKLLQIREVPDAIHRTLKARAAQDGRSLSDYLRAELALIAARPTPAELEELLLALPEIAAGEDSAAIIRARRDDA